MKTKFILAVTLILFAQSSQAQIFKKYQKSLQDKIEKKANDLLKQTQDKADQKIDNTIDGAINKTTDKVTGATKKKNSSSDNGSSNQSSNQDELSIDDITNMNGEPYSSKGQNIETPDINNSNNDLLVGAGVAKDQYQFSQYIKLKTKNKDGKDKKNVIRTYRIDYGTTPDVMAISNMVVEGKPQRKSYELDNQIYDIERDALFVFIKQNNVKSYTSLAFHTRKLADNELSRTTTYRVRTVTKTGETKMIAGKLAEAYLCKTNDSEATIWISQADGVNPYPAFYTILNSTSTGDKRGALVFYNTKEIRERLQAGAMILAYKFTKHKYNDDAEMEVLSFGSASTSFDTRPYKTPKKD